MTTNAVILDAITDRESGVYFWQRVIQSASDMDFYLEYTSL